MQDLNKIVKYLKKKPTVINVPIRIVCTRTYVLPPFFNFKNIVRILFYSQQAQCQKIVGLSINLILLVPQGQIPRYRLPYGNTYSK